MSDAADAAWEAAHAAGDEAERRRQLMTSAAHYGQLLQLSDGLLGAHHTLLLVARHSSVAITLTTEQTSR